MVLRKNLKKKFALISVFEKRNLKYLCSNLDKFNYSFMSSGSTGEKIRELGFRCQDISKLTNFKKWLSSIKSIGRVYSSTISFSVSCKTLGFTDVSLSFLIKLVNNLSGLFGI